MTTLYIEEVFSSSSDDYDDAEEDRDEEEGFQRSIECNKIDTDIVTTITTAGATNADTTYTDVLTENKEDATYLLRGKKLSPCPIVTGGGASFSIIGRKGYVFGGCSRSGEASSKVHCYDFDIDAWHCNVQCKGICKPDSTFAHSATVYKSYIYIFGGQSTTNTTCNCTQHNKQNNDDMMNTVISFTSVNTMFCLNTKTMEWINHNAQNDDHISKKKLLPAPRNSHSSVYSKHTDSIIIFGGANENVGTMNDVWCFNLKAQGTDVKHGGSWEQLICNGREGPSPREMHSACVDNNTNCMYIVGGRDGKGNFCNDLWALHLVTKVWNRIGVTQSPRCAHTVNILTYSLNQYLVLHGGWDGASTIFNDFQLFDMNEKKWVSNVSLLMSPQSNLPPRFGHASATIETGDGNNIIIIFGGVNAKDDLQEMTWLELEQ